MLVLYLNGIAYEADGNPGRGDRPHVRCGSISVHHYINNSATLEITLVDPDGMYQAHTGQSKPRKGETVLLVERDTLQLPPRARVPRTTISTERVLFGGTVDDVQEEGLGPLIKYGDSGGSAMFNMARSWKIGAVDWNLYADRFYVAEVYEDMLAGDIVRDQVSKKLQGVDPLFSDENVKFGQIGDGAQVKNLIADYAKLSDLFNQVAGLSGYSWWIQTKEPVTDYRNPEKEIHFIERAALQAPIQFGDYTGNFRSMSVRYGRAGAGPNSQYANDVFLRFNRETLSKETASYVGDGSSQVFPRPGTADTLLRPIANPPQILLSGIEQRVGHGPQADDEGQDWYWTRGGTVIRQNTNDPPISDTDTLEIKYDPLFADVIESVNPAEIQVTYEIEGGSGKYQALEEKTDFTDAQAVIDYVEALKRILSFAATTVTVETDEPDLRPGQAVTIQSTRHTIETQQFLITELHGSLHQSAIGPTAFIRWSLTAVSGEHVGGWIEYFKSLLNHAGGITAVVGGGAGGVPGKILFDVRRPQLEDYGHLAVDGIAVEDNKGLKSLQHIEFLAPSIDESDPGLWGEGSIDATSDPAVFTPTITDGSRLGRSFASGTLVQWDDPKTLVIGGVSRYSSEINQVTDINPFTGQWTLRRHIPDDVYGTAMYGSDMAAHANKKFYPLVLPENFKMPVGIDGYSRDRPYTPSGLGRSARWSHRSMSVAAVASVGKGPGGYGPVHIVNLADPNQSPKCPGLRTHSGAAYTNLGRDGALAVGQRERFPVSVMNWHATRCVFGKVGTAPVGSNGTFSGVQGDIEDAGIVVYVLYFAPADSDDEGDRNVALVETIAIGENLYRSYAFDDQPDGRQMPYGMTWPTKLLPIAGKLGTLALPLALTGAKLIERPDGQYGFLIAAVGTVTAGRDLIITVQK